MALSVRSTKTYHGQYRRAAIVVAALVAASIAVGVAVQVAPTVSLGAKVADDAATGLAAQRLGEIGAGTTASGIAAYRAGEIGAAAGTQFAAPANEWAPPISVQRSVSNGAPSHPLDGFRGR